MTTSFPSAKRGSTYRHRLRFSGTSGTIAACVIRMMIKRNVSEADAVALASIDNALLGGITIVTATSPYEIDIVIADTVMATLPVGGLVAGVQIELPDGTTEEIEMDQTFRVLGDVVRAVAAP